jgi:hypothetical protein
MAEVEWLHLCDHAFFDEHRKPCLVGLFRTITAEHVPAAHSKCSLVFSVTGEPKEIVDVEILLVGPDGKAPIMRFRNTSLDLGPGGVNTTNISFDSVPLPDFGRYEFQVLLNGRLAKCLPLGIRRAKSAGRRR